MYVIKRTHRLTGRSQYWSNDTARSFWYGKPDKRWMKAYPIKADAEQEFNNVQANHTHLWWSYALIDVPYSQSELRSYFYPPIDNTIEDQRNSCH